MIKKAEELYKKLISGEIQPLEISNTILLGPERKQVVSAFTGIFCELLLSSDGDQDYYTEILDGLIDRGISPFEEDVFGHYPASYAQKFSTQHFLEFIKNLKVV